MWYRGGAVSDKRGNYCFRPFRPRGAQGPVSGPTMLPILPQSARPTTGGQGITYYALFFQRRARSVRAPNLTVPPNIGGKRECVFHSDGTRSRRPRCGKRVAFSSTLPERATAGLCSSVVSQYRPSRHFLWGPLAGPTPRPSVPAVGRRAFGARASGFSATRRNVNGIAGGERQ